MTCLEKTRLIFQTFLFSSYELWKHIIDLENFLNLLYVIACGTASYHQIRSFDTTEDMISSSDILIMRICSCVLSFVFILKILKSLMMFDTFHDTINSFFFVYSTDDNLFILFTMMVIMFICSFSVPFWLLSK